MVDFKLMGKLTQQYDMVLALFRHKVFRSITVLVRDRLDADRLSSDMFAALQEPNYPRKIVMCRQSRTISIKDTVMPEGYGHCRFITYTDYHRMQGQEMDLLWIRYWDYKGDRIALSKFMSYVRKGYNQLILEGNVTYDRPEPEGETYRGAAGPSVGRDREPSGKSESDAGDGSTAGDAGPATDKW